MADDTLGRGDASGDSGGGGLLGGGDASRDRGDLLR